MNSETYAKQLRQFITKDDLPTAFQKALLQNACFNELTHRFILELPKAPLVKVDN